MQNPFAVKPQPPLDQFWFDALLEALKSPVRRGIRRFTRADVRRLLMSSLDLIPRDKHDASVDAAIGYMTAKRLWSPGTDGAFTLSANGLSALDIAASGKV